MKTNLMASKRNLVSLAVLMGLIVAGSPSALAVPPSQVYRNYTEAIFDDLCCKLWGDSVFVTEPSMIQPVVVTWSAEYKTIFDDFYVGLSVNGGPCLAYGPRSIFNEGDYRFPQSKTFQWVVLPSDGLVKGKNTFTVCGGTVSHPVGTIYLGIRTLSVRFSK